MPNAIGVVEFISVSRGIYVTDQMLKTSEVEVVSATSICPGKYMSIIHGDVAAVEDAVRVGIKLAGEFGVDSTFIPNVDPNVFPAITGATMPDHISALGIMETFSVSTMIIVADAVLKSADLQPIDLRLGNALGGKAYFTFTGDVGAVKAGMEAGIEIAKEKGFLVNAEFIASPDKGLVATLL
ncbi:BMC domain-containing protein [Niameybacter massiliensis]|uniref:BMC domain-containing protein n=1 Tax=Holtiella tumoricola TaxID=3018743 RepID=A0AA42DQK4_9FIRM|nr:MULTISPECIES: BMC domain-containing protein [Lachnospirales]MDA3733508.1 BMC domain-containing protein [Holtiella tumoricola]